VLINRALRGCTELHSRTAAAANRESWSARRIPFGGAGGDPARAGREPRNVSV